MFEPNEREIAKCTSTWFRLAACIFFIKIIGLCFIARRAKASLACSHGVHRSPTLHILTNRKFSACLVLHTVRSGFSCSFLPHSISSDARTDESSDGAESSASLWVHHAHEAAWNNGFEACGCEIRFSCAGGGKSPSNLWLLSNFCWWNRIFKYVDFELC